MDENELLAKQEMHDKIESELSSAFGSVGAVSFSQLESIGKAQEFYDDIRALTAVATILLSNISWRFSPEANNKENVQLIKELVSDYVQRLEALTAEVQTDEQKSISEKTKGFITKVFGMFSKDADVDKEQNFKTEEGKKFYASDYLYVPDRDKPSTWKLRISEGKSGNVTVAQLGRAAAAFSSGGFRGNKVQLPSGEAARIKAKLRAKYRSLGVKEEDMPDSIKKELESSFQIIKQSDGNYRWIAIHSNNFQDLDQDILSKESHVKFVDMVDKGLVEYPELWHWHVPGTAWGKADMVAFDEQTGMTVSSGVVYKGHEAEAEALSNAPFAVGVSHGMPKTSVRRDPRDPHIITEYITKEISDLPLVNAANRLTHFVIHKEEVMPIPAAKKDYLKSVGISDEVIEDLEATMQKSSDDAVADGIVSKEVEGEAETTPEITPVTEDATTEVGEVGNEDDKADDKEKSEEKASQVLTKEDISAAIAESISGITKEINEAISELRGKVDALSTELKESKVEQEIAKEKLAMTPASSLAAMISGQLKASSASETVVRKNSSLLKDAPEETEAPEDGGVIATQNPLLNKVIASIVGGNKSTPTQ